MNDIRIQLPQNQIAAFCKRNKIAKLSIFGSAKRDDFGTVSDIDVLVEFEPGARGGLITFAGILRYRQYRDNRFQLVQQQDDLFAILTFFCSIKQLSPGDHRYSCLAGLKFFKTGQYLCWLVTLDINTDIGVQHVAGRNHSPSLCCG